VLQWQGMHENIFTIIVPTYNRATLLRRALDSILTQTFPHFTVVVIDDQSTDETDTIIREYSTDSRLVYHRQPERRGETVARNTAYDLAKGKLITYLDDDDWLAPDALETAYRYYTDLGVEQAHWLMFDCVAMPSGEIDNSAERSEGYLRYEDILCGKISGNFWLVYSRELIESPRVRHDERLWGNVGQMYLQIWRDHPPYYVPKGLYFADKRGLDRLSTVVSTVATRARGLTNEEIYLSVFGEDLRKHCPRLLARRLSRLAYLHASNGNLGRSLAYNSRALRYGLTLDAAKAVARSAVGWAEYVGGRMKRRAGAA
jgi:GalNAc5-diNAcBac-PP-undecaprenol beta-1,3-glucosyltransferase